MIGTDPNDTTTYNQVIGAPIQVGATPLGVVVSPDGKRAYVTNWDGASVSVINTEPGAPGYNEVIGTPIPVGESPIAAAVSPDGRYVYVGHYGGDDLAVIDTSTPIPTVTHIAVPEAFTVAVNPIDGDVYVTNFHGNTTDHTVSVIDPTDPDNPTVIPLVNDLIPMGVAVSPDGNHVYVTAFRSVQVIDTTPNSLTRNNIVATIDDVATQANSFGLVVSPDSSLLYVIDVDGGGVSVIDTSSPDSPTYHQAIATVPLTDGPMQLAATGNDVYVANTDGNVTVISLVPA